MAPSLTITHIAWAFVIAAMFSQWAIVSKATGVHGLWVAVLVLIGSCIGGIVPIAPKLHTLPAPTLKAALIVVAAGVVNGAAMYFYPVKLSDPSVPTGPFITASMAAMVVLSIVFTALVEWQLPSLRLVLGALVICLGLVVIAG